MKKIVYSVLCLAVCFAIYETNSWGAEVKGNNNNWTLIGAVKQGSVIKINASGTVDFGCSWPNSCKDSVTAGVTGSNALTSSLHMVADEVAKIGSLAAPPDPNHPLDKFKQTYDVINQVFGSSQPVHYDQGGVWIKILNKHGAPYIGTQLYYYWANGINNYGLPINEDVNVYAKAHDGGRNPEATGGYGDNKGSYDVNIQYTIQPHSEPIVQPGSQLRPVTSNPPTVVKEDCIPFNSATITVSNIQGRWKIIDGSRWLFDFGGKEQDARTAFAIIEKYGFNNICYIGRPQPSFQYLLHK